MTQHVKERIKEVRERLARLPRARLAHLPTPLDHCANLTCRLDGPDIFIKRDDCTGLAFGGNKSRQHEYILGRALDEGADCVIQGAAAQSNHARQLAAAGAKLGLDVYLIPKQDGRSRPIQGNLLVDHILGANIAMVPPETVMSDAKERLAAELRSQGRRPFVVGMGASTTLALAAVAYVDACVEIAEQSLEIGGLPDAIYSPSQGGTQAGLLLGTKLLGLDTKVVGINPMLPTHEAYAPPAEVAELANTAAGMLECDMSVDEGEITNLTDYVGEEYGIPSPAGLAALKLLAKTEGILLDPVYTSKAFSGLLDHIQKGNLHPGERVVFLHTGGTPALFAYSEELLADQ